MTAIFVTGAGSGIGRALADRSIIRGDITIAGVFSEAEAASFRPTANLHVVRIDVGNSESVIAAFDKVDKWLEGTALDVVIHCAGCCPLGALEVQDPQILLDTLNVNAVGSARILRAALPRLRGHAGRIGLVTSLWGKVSGPMLSAYCASKFAIEAIADATRREIDGQDVSIVLLEPGVVRTPLVANQISFAQRAADALSPDQKSIYAELYRKYHGLISRNASGGLSAEQAAQRIEAAIFANKPATRAKIGNDSKVVSALARLLPDRALDTMFRKMLN
jgi:NAD(P)-dependent dehydrogenase (short-subunit alcohol dehydrogenase family)